jgi:hypothetical protein
MPRETRLRPQMLLRVLSRLPFPVLSVLDMGFVVIIRLAFNQPAQPTDLQSQRRNRSGR